MMCVMAMAACSSITGKSAGETIDDATITAKVKAKLASEKIGTLTKVDVDTVKGTVYLNGTVENPEMRERLAMLARDVPGVREVVNNVTVPSATRTR